MASKKKAPAKPTVAQAFKAAQKSTSKKTSKPNIDVPEPIKGAAKAVGKAANKVGNVTLGNVGDTIAYIPWEFLNRPTGGRDYDPSKDKWFGYNDTRQDVIDAWARYDAKKNKGKGKKATSPLGKLADVTLKDIAKGITGLGSDKLPTKSVKKAAKKQNTKKPSTSTIRKK